MKKFILSLLLVLMIQSGFGQLFSWQYPSPKASALGGAITATSGDQWSAFYNPAGLTLLEQKSVGVSYLNLYNLSFLKSYFIAIGIPLSEKYGALGISYGRFGVDYEGESVNSEWTLILSYARYVFKDFNSSLAFGMNARILRWEPGTSLEYGDLGTVTKVAMDFGFQASLFQRTWLGMYLTNANSPKVGVENRYDVPKIFAVGLAYKPYSGVTTSLDIRTDFLSRESQYWGGIEVEVNPYLTLRAGSRMNPNQFTTGFGFHYKYFTIDYALITHPELSETHQMGVVIGW